MEMMQGKSVLLIISGGIAAYKSLELIRLIRKAGGNVRCIVTKGGEQFVTSMSVSALCEHPAYTDLWSLKDEAEMGHIRLTREADIVVVAPASADIIAKMSNGFASDLATTTLLASDKDVIIAPAMNHKMWEHPATQENIKTLKQRGTTVLEPASGEMACGEFGTGRMVEPQEIFGCIIGYFNDMHAAGNMSAKSSAQSRHSNQSSLGPLAGKKVLITAGPTYEPIDPVRFIGNRSSGKQGYAIATALRDAGAQVTLISGPVTLPEIAGIETIYVNTGTEMLDACSKALPADIGIFAAAVSDWSAKTIMTQKIKKHSNKTPPKLELKETPDILATLARPSRKRPALVIGFAAETDNLLEYAKDKQKNKGCDWILANDVSEQSCEQTDRKNTDSVFGSEENHVYLITHDKTEEWTKTTKAAIAQKLTDEIIGHFGLTDAKSVIQDKAKAAKEAAKEITRMAKELKQRKTAQ